MTWQSYSIFYYKLLLNAVFLDHVSYRGCWPISQITHQSTWKWRNDRCSELNFCNCVKTPEKKSQDFNGVWTRDLAIPVWCSTNWAMKPLTLGAGQLSVNISVTISVERPMRVSQESVDTSAAWRFTDGWVLGTDQPTVGCYSIGSLSAIYQWALGRVLVRNRWSTC